MSAENLENYLPKLRSVVVGGVVVEPATNGKAGFAGNHSFVDFQIGNEWYENF